MEISCGDHIGGASLPTQNPTVLLQLIFAFEALQKLSIAISASCRLEFVPFKNNLVSSVNSASNTSSLVTGKLMPLLLSRLSIYSYPL